MKKLIIWDFDGVIADTNYNWHKREYKLTEGIVDIFKLSDLDQCIVTGGTMNDTLHKIKKCGIENFFTEQNTFSTDMINSEKSEKDIFVLASLAMGYEPQNAIVIDDSYSAMIGALKAGCTPVAFLGNNSEIDIKYHEHIEKLGIQNIFYKMSDIKKFICQIIKRSIP